MENASKTCICCLQNQSPNQFISLHCSAAPTATCKWACDAQLNPPAAAATHSNELDLPSQPQAHLRKKSPEDEAKFYHCGVHSSDTSSLAAACKKKTAIQRAHRVARCHREDLSPMPSLTQLRKQPWLPPLAISPSLSPAGPPSAFHQLPVSPFDLSPSQPHFTFTGMPPPQTSFTLFSSPSQTPVPRSPADPFLFINWLNRRVSSPLTSCHSTWPESSIDTSNIEALAILQECDQLQTMIVSDPSMNLQSSTFLTDPAVNPDDWQCMQEFHRTLENLQMETCS
ncbi:hypothetical protein EMPG_15106 [Blastomyces silverae]|uniref:Uncharacterized protein n=1 Tax=Blastomyces silverae TaxID=2060906 RepID=A0A0H1BEM2_9EURO|nr:hypothetical protein EMPG_15106 [Blastomyces silverae]